ncbi:MAG TPA: hypothetical protein VF516_44900, partial [Kofleriaceae bacterium]
MQDRAHSPDLAAAPDLGPLPAPAADLGLATALLQHLQAIGRLTPNDIAAALQRYPQLREAVLHVVAAHWGTRGVQALVDAEAQYGAPAAATAPAIVTGSAATQAAAPAHAASVHQVAERDALNAVI